ERRGVVLEVAAPLRARDGDDVLPLSVHPCERDLRGRRPVRLGDGADALDDREVLVEVLALEARLAVAEVARVEVVEAGERAGEEAAPEWAVRHEADPELAHRRQELGLRGAL